MMALITSFKLSKYTLLVNNWVWKDIWFSLNKWGSRNIYGLCRINRILTNYHSNISEFKIKKTRASCWKKKKNPHTTLVFHWCLVEVYFILSKIKFPKERFKRSSCIFNLRGWRPWYEERTKLRLQEREKNWKQSMCWCQLKEGHREISFTCICSLIKKRKMSVSTTNHYGNI